MDTSQIRVLSFDLDDTLWDGNQVILKAEQAMLDWMQQHTPNVFERFTKESLRQHKFQFIKNNPHLMNRISEARQRYLAELFSELNHSNPLEKSKACFDAFYQARQQVVLFEGVTDTLETLKQHFQLIAITNGNADIHLTGLGGFFDVALNAEDFSQPKPHGDIFKAGLGHTHARAEQCLHIGDHPEHDMLGAYNVGMKTCWLKDGSREWNQDFKAHIEIRHVSELLPLLIK